MIKLDQTGRIWRSIRSILVGIFAVVFLSGLIMSQIAQAYDATACARKICSHSGTMCSQPYPAQECMSGLPPSGDCVCYTDFTIEFTQDVRLSGSALDDSCGFSTNNFFILVHPDSSPAGAWEMAGGVGWNSVQELAPDTYRIKPDRMEQWGGNYCVEYWAGPKRFSGEITMSDPNFGTIDAGDCSSWHSATFSNDGNVIYTIDSVSSENAAFEVNAPGLSVELEPEEEYDFSVRFCAPGTIGADQYISTPITVSFSGGGDSGTRQVLVDGTAHVAQGELDVPSSFDVGTADWTLNEYIEKDLRIRNIGDAAMMSVTATLVDNAGGVFSLPSGGNVGTIDGDGHYEDVTVRCTPTDETDYIGQLNVYADYGNGLSSTETVTLQCTGHHPEPRLSLLTTDINYGEVELDYRFRQAVKIKNDGDATLTFSVSIAGSSDSDEDQFILSVGDIGPVPEGETILLEMTFAPNRIGDSDISLVVDNSNDPTFTSSNVNLHGIGVNPLPLSTMMVIDRSRSMDAAAGEVKKIEAASNAGILYADIILRDEFDWFGITKYNQDYETIVDLAPIADNHDDAVTKLEEIDLESGLNPSGSTCMGGGMLEASQSFSSSPDQNAQAMIVLTDGKENEEPWIANVLPDITSEYPDLKIFCIGIGDPIETDAMGLEGIETPKLQQIAENTNGLFRVTGSVLSGEQRYDLEAFYFKVFTHARGGQMALDPTYMVLPSAQVQQVASVNIVECDREVDFLIISELFENKTYRFLIQLQDPTGQIIDPSSTIGGVGVHIKEWGKYRLVRIKFPPRNMSDSYSGVWKLLMQPVQPEVVPELTHVHVPSASTQPGVFRVAFLAAVKSDYRTQASVTKGEVLVGQPTHVSAKLTEAWWPSPGGEVTVKITKPDGSVTNKALFDDGAHADGEASDAEWGLEFTETYQKGLYEFYIRGTGVTERGETVVREELISKYVGKLAEKEPAQPCIPCTTLRWLIVLFFLILIAILILVVRCCCIRK